MGNAPDGNEVPVTLNDKIWEYINVLECETTSLVDGNTQEKELQVFPNPAMSQFALSIYDLHGNRILRKSNCYEKEVIQELLLPGIYMIHVIDANGSSYFKKVVVSGE